MPQHYRRMFDDKTSSEEEVRLDHLYFNSFAKTITEDKFENLGEDNNYEKKRKVLNCLLNYLTQVEGLKAKFLNLPYDSARYYGMLNPEASRKVSWKYIRSFLDNYNHVYFKDEINKKIKDDKEALNRQVAINKELEKEIKSLEAAKARRNEDFIKKYDRFEEKIRVLENTISQKYKEITDLTMGLVAGGDKNLAITKKKLISAQAYIKKLEDKNKKLKEQLELLIEKVKA